MLLNPRPRSIGMRNTSKYPGDTLTQPTRTAPCARGRPTISKGSPDFVSKGTADIALDAITPGSASMRCVASRTSRLKTRVLSKCVPARDMWSVSTLCVSKPRCTARRAMNERINRADPMRSISASAVSLMTSMERARLWRIPIPERPLSLIGEMRSPREA